jgi:TATA-binding protein-associated factor
VSSGGEERTNMEGLISSCGSELPSKHVKFGSSLFEELLKLWDSLTEFFKPIEIKDDIQKDDPSIAQLGRSCEDKDPQSLINNIQVCSIRTQFGFYVIVAALHRAAIFSTLRSS